MALYPPIVASSMPAFNIQEGKVRIYFTLSDYNSVRQDDIKKVHVTVRRQSSNVNVLVDNNEIIERSFGLQEDIDKAFHRYYVEINNSDIISGFKANVLYKVQLRLSSQSISSSSSTAASFYTNDINKFSEWSTVCLIKPINPPQFYIDDFYIEGEEPKEQDINNFSNDLADFVGVYKANKSSQTLKSWRLRLLSGNYSKEFKQQIDDFTLSDSGTQLVSAYNYTLDDNSVVLECSLPYELKEKTNYKLLFEVQTKNDYKNSLLYTFLYTPQTISPLEGELKSFINEEQGYIKINCVLDDDYMGNLVIRRSDSKTNFLKWEDLKNFESKNEKEFDYYDFTAESGLAYKYLIQKRDVRGRRGTPLYLQSPVMAEWEHAFLLETAGNGDIEKAKQLKLKFDFQISSFKTNIAENKTDTIGSKYPFIRRNGNMYYRSFPCSGLITAYMDNIDLFTSEEELYNNHAQIYKQFQGNINDFAVQYDYTNERKFREKVQEFLYNIKPKLYKSMQEGNIFIKLMDVSLTPKTQLGRLVYSFSATAYQIDQASIKNYDYYGLINIGNYNPNVYYPDTKIGQVNSYDAGEDNPIGKPFPAGFDIVGAGIRPAANSIAARHNYNKPINGQVLTDFNLTWLRITIESQPYLIKYVNGKFYPIDDVDSPATPLRTDDPLNQQRGTFSSFKDKRYVTENDSIEYISNPVMDYPSRPGQITHKLYQMQATYDASSIYLGTLLEINGEQIIISPPNNIYELKGDSIRFTKGLTIIPYKDTAMTVDYLINLHIEEDTSKVPKFIRTDQANGQLVGTYNENDELISRISYKYKSTIVDDDTIQQRVEGVQTILVDTEPGAIVYLSTTADNEIRRFVVNETGELFFDPCDSQVYVNKMYIKGMNIPKEYTYDRGAVGSIDEVLSPVDNDMCTVGSDKWVFYKNKWYKAKEEDEGQSYDIFCPVDALVFYYATIRRDFY